MKTYLLENSNFDYIPLIIIFVGLILFVLIILYLKHKEKVELKKEIKNNTNSQINLSVNNYCNEKEMIFLEYLHKALPKDFIAFPRVGVDQILQPKGNKIMYNKVLAKYVDICVFLRSEMKPVLIIDLIDTNPATQALCEMDLSVKDALKSVKLPILKQTLSNTYNLDELKKKCYDLIDVKILLRVK